MNKQFYTIPEVAQILGISRIAVFKKVKAGKIKAIKIGEIYAIPREELGIILGETLSGDQKKVLKAGVRKTIRDYSEVLEKLGKE